MVVPVALGIAACGGDSPESAVTSPPTTLVPPCSVERHVVALDVFGTASLSHDDAAAWIADPAAVPAPRPGAAEVAAAYRTHGYEVLYMTTTPDDTVIGGTPLSDALVGWLDANGFPTGDGTRLWVWDGDHTALSAISRELGRVTDSGATLAAAYTDNEDKAFAFKTDVPSDKVFTLGAGASTPGTTPVAGDDMQAHAAEVAGTDPVCAPG